MPELPEVETVLRSLAPSTTGRRILDVHTSRQRLRGAPPAPARRLAREVANSRIVEWTRRGKYLLLRLSSGSTLLIHLGMSGRLLLEPRSSPAVKHTHVVLELDRGQDLRFVDPRRFGAVQCLDPGELRDHAALSAMGPEPLSRALDARSFAARLARRVRAIKPALLDQGLVAGIGNIYASESLHLARVHPCRPCNQIREDEVAALVSAIKKTLRRAISNCGTTLKDYTDGWGVRGGYHRYLRVFDRAGDPCKECGAVIESFSQQGRTTYFCPGCQRVRR